LPLIAYAGSRPIFENFVLDPARRELRRGNALITVQPQVFDLLEYLITNRDRVVSKEDILGAVWGGRIVSESALTTRINATRTAVDDDGDQQRLIRTIPRKGIRFVGVVQERAQPAEEASTALAVVDTDTLEPAAEGRDQAPSAERRQPTIASCELLLGTVAAAIDPEDLPEIIQNYHNCVVETTGRHNGLVAHTYGHTAFRFHRATVNSPTRS
jgi:DNA-binding winged helix-turn-helix (wHTH) protein